jgi:molybdenum cofactor cytidylyltransferase
MRLRDALRVQRGDVVAFIGAGGKTSALFRLGHELRREGWRVLATTTTRLARSEMEFAPLAAPLTPSVSAQTIREWLDEYAFVFLHRDNPNHDKVLGLPLDTIPHLIDSVNSDILLIEADGSRRLPLKAPRDHEPVIPPETSLVVVVAGVDILGQPLDDEHVYNAQRIQDRYGFPEGGEIIPPWMALTIRDPQLGLRGIPDSARVVSLLNKVSANSSYHRTRARRVAQLVLRSSRVDSVVLGAMKAPREPVFEVQQRVGAVVLAAGLSSRMGRSKVLLPWGERTVIETIVNRLLAARLSEIIIVTGHRADDVERLFAGLPVKVVQNPNYAAGEMLSSVQTGIRALGDSVNASLIVMGDQPLLDPRVIGRVLAAYAEGKGTIIAPTYRGERGHPVLMDRRFWPELLALDNGAPRDVIRRYPDQLALIDVDTDSILSDIDTPEQYQQARRQAGLR